MDILFKTKKKEVMDKIMQNLEKSIEEWLRSNNKTHSLIISLDRARGDVDVSDIQYVCASMEEVESKGLMEEYREGRVIISTCC